MDNKNRNNTLKKLDLLYDNAKNRISSKIRKSLYNERSSTPERNPQKQHCNLFKIYVYNMELDSKEYLSQFEKNFF